MRAWGASLLRQAATIRMPPKRSLAGPASPSAIAKRSKTSEPGDAVFIYDALAPATLHKRYKRFLGDVTLNDGTETTIHVPNTGPMTGLLDTLPSLALLSVSSNPARKYKHTLEWLKDSTGAWVGVHSAKANAFVRALLEANAVPELGSYEKIRAEVKYGAGGASRVDFVLDKADGGEVYVEVKSVTLAENDGEKGRIALFPDTVSTRALRHVTELAAVVKQGKGKTEAALVFLVQRGDCDSFAPCFEKDPEYAAAVATAAAAGVKMIALVCDLDEEKGAVVFKGTLPVRLDYKVPVESV